jgi:hypothetical protein
MAPNSPSGTFVSYWLASNADTARIRISSSDGILVRELTGPATRGMHRVAWDLRTQFAFVPPASDSGFYGPPRAPYVPAGDYTVQLTASGKTLTRTVRVRTDPRALTTPEALRARWAMMTEVDSLGRLFAPERATFVATDSEYTRLVKSLGADTAATRDSVVKRAGATLSTLRGKFATSYSAPIGQAFDLLGGLESSSAAPTAAERRTLDSVTADLRDAFAKLHDLIATDMPKLRQLAASATPR